MAAVLITDPTLPTAVAIKSSLESIHKHGSTHFTAKTAAEFVDEVRSDEMKDKLLKAQTEIMKEIHSASVRHAVLSQRDRVRIMSCRGPHASHWITKLPTHKEFQLSGPELSAAIRHRIGLAPADHETIICNCGKQITNDNHEHYHVCKRGLAWRIPRHNTILTAYHKIATKAGSESVREYRTSLPDMNKTRQKTDLRPDAAITGVNHKFFIDVTVTTPTATSIMDRDRDPVSGASGSTPLFAAKLREKFKKTKYSDVALAEHADFYAVVMESYGAIGEQMVESLNVLHAAHKDSVEDSNWSLKSWAVRVLSFALQRGNARLALSANRLTAGRRLAARQ